MAHEHIKAKLRSKVRSRIFGILALLAAAGIFVAPSYANRAIDKINAAAGVGIPHVPAQPFRLGLDLQGGVHLIYEAELSQIAINDQPEAVEGVRDVIERRVNGMGVGEPNVQTTKVGETYRLLVELPGVSDVHEAIAMIGETPILEFKKPNQTPPRDLTADEQKELDEFNATARQRAEELISSARSGEKEFIELAKIVTEDTASRNNGGYLGYIGANSHQSELYETAGKMENAEIYPELVQTGEGLNILKRGADKEGDKQVRASHILICFLGAQGCTDGQYTKEEAYQKAQEVYEQANAENFGELSAQFSTDASNANFGGSLGWFSRGAMVPDFEEAVFAADSGSIIGPVETRFGYHIIYKQEERTTTEYELWRILVRTKSAGDILPPQDAFVSTELSGKNLERAEVVTDPQTGAIQVSLQFDGDGKELFKELTEEFVGQPIAIYLDGQPISVPTVQVPITDGRAVITGNFNIQDARVLSQRLNAGALPVPITLVSEQAIGATLGLASLQKSLKAGIVGVLVVMLFMVFYYRLPGLLSVLALTLYITLTLAVFKLMGVTLTLAGIAGFILSIGMAVDANVLIFERLKEELRDGKSLKTSIEEGFIRAWSSIRDGNISTLITCALLIWFGSSFVQGFAVALSIGILLSMFTAISVTRVLLRFVAPWCGQDKAINKILW